MKGLFAALGRALISLRYRIRVNKGALDDMRKTGRGMLFLPNHTAEIDPIILNVLLFRLFRPRPLVIEYFYYLTGGHFFMRLVRALPVPNFEPSANQWKVRQVEKCLTEVKAGLKRGEHFLIYPSGQLKREGYETIGGNSFVHRLLQDNPDLDLVLVRMTGLWGSLFSRAITRESPQFWDILARGLRALLKSGLFFLPRRKVEVSFEVNPSDFPRRGERMEINRYLERWYNQYRDEKGNFVTSEPLTLVSLSCFATVLPKLTPPKLVEKDESLGAIDPTVKQAVFEKLAALSQKKVEEISIDAELSRGLGLDSLDFSELQAFLDEQFGIERFVPEELQTVGAVLQLAARQKGREKKVAPLNFTWAEEEERPAVEMPEGETVQAVFLQGATQRKKALACADGTIGALSYQKLKMATLALQKAMRHCPGRYVGVLLPSSVAGYLVILAILLAGKIPVILNWTMGARSLNFAAQLLGLEAVVTARRFLERLDVLELGDLEDRLVLMEEVRAKMTLWHKVGALFHARKKSATLLKQLGLERIEPTDPAVILFTSGTETEPKAVPLSHLNLLGNQRAILKANQLKRSDILYGVLPPFHSFGLSVTGLLPLLLGIRVFYAPDPTDPHAMARDLAACQATLMCCAPSFYRQLFKVASSDDLASLRLFVAGAEKATPDLFEAVSRLGNGATMIEGYGITECAPVVTLNRQGDEPKGVGRPLDGVELLLIHPESGEKISEKGGEGEVCIRSVGVFSGYLGHEVADPFIEIDGKKWYRSGDLGSIDPSGALKLSGRLKRFVKIGGEMISLKALEEEIERFVRTTNQLVTDDGLPQIALGVKKRSETSKPELILFATVPLTVEEVNGCLRQAGFGRIVKVRAVKQIAVIPLTGTGKVHDRRIREMSQEQ